MRSHDEFDPGLREFHPDFGYLYPSRRLRSRVRLALSAAIFGILVGAIGATLVSGRSPRDPARVDTALTLRPVSPDAARQSTPQSTTMAPDDAPLTPTPVDVPAAPVPAAPAPGAGGRGAAEPEGPPCGDRPTAGGGRPTTGHGGLCRAVNRKGMQGRDLALFRSPVSVGARQGAERAGVRRKGKGSGGSSGAC